MKKVSGYCFLMIALYTVSSCSLFSDAMGKKNIGSNLISQDAKCVVPLSKEEVDYTLQNSTETESIWNAKENAIRARVVASNNLNEYAGLPNAMSIGIYQISKLDIAVKEISTQSGLRRMLLLEKLDASILQYDIQTLQPRSSARLDISRAEGAKYLVVIAGYQSLISDQVVRIVQMPLVRFTKSLFNPINWFSADAKPFPAELDVLVRLGSNKIEDFVVQVRNECGG